MRLKITFVKRNRAADNLRVSSMWGGDHVDVKLLGSTLAVQGVTVAERDFDSRRWNLYRRVFDEHKIGTEVHGGFKQQQDNIFNVDYDDIEIDVV